MQRRSQKPGDAVPSGGRVVVFRALPGLGDFLCAVPSLRAIRRARPDVEIHLVGLPNTDHLAARFAAYIDRFEPFPGFPGLLDRTPDVHLLPGFLAAMQSWDFDLAIQLHGSGELTNSIVALFDARAVAGFHREPLIGLPASTFVPWLDDCSEIRQGLRLVSHLGWDSRDESLEFPVHAVGDAEAIAAVGSDVLANPYVVLHPGASVASRRWSPLHFAAVGDALAASGRRVILTGAASEAGITAQVAAAMRMPVMDAAGRTSLDGVAAILRNAAIVVCNDTGVSHLAAALRVPSVVVFTDSSIQRWAPLDQRRHRVTTGRLDDVLGEARALLGEPHRHAA